MGLSVIQNVCAVHSDGRFEVTETGFQRGIDKVIPFLIERCHMKIVFLHEIDPADGISLLFSHETAAGIQHNSERDAFLLVQSDLSGIPALVDHQKSNLRGKLECERLCRISASEFQTLRFGENVSFSPDASAGFRQNRIHIFLRTFRQRNRLPVVKTNRFASQERGWDFNSENLLCQEDVSGIILESHGDFAVRSQFYGLSENALSTALDLKRTFIPEDFFRFLEPGCKLLERRPFRCGGNSAVHLEQQISLVEKLGKGISASDFQELVSDPNTSPVHYRDGFFHIRRYCGFRKRDRGNFQLRPECRRCERQYGDPCFFPTHCDLLVLLSAVRCGIRFRVKRTFHFVIFSGKGKQRVSPVFSGGYFIRFSWAIEFREDALPGAPERRFSLSIRVQH